MADEKKSSSSKKKASSAGSSKRERGPSEYAEKESRRPRRRAPTRFVFKFAALIIVLLAAWFGWIIYRSGGSLSDVLDVEKRAQLLDKAAEDYRQAVKASDEARKWAQKEFKNWEESLSKRLKSPPPKTKEESAALVKETQKEIKEPAPPPPVQKSTAAAKPKTNTALAKARDEYNLGMKDYAMTDPAASQQQVQKYIRLAAGHFEVCLFHIDKARASGVSEGLLERYEQPATKRLYDCRKRMELKLR